MKRFLVAALCAVGLLSPVAACRGTGKPTKPPAPISDETSQAQPPSVTVFSGPGGGSGPQPGQRVIFPDSTFRIFDDVDTTKLAAFQASGITTATTRTYTFPNSSLTLTGFASNQLIAPTLGTVGAPSYTWTGDLDTGMYATGANSIGLATSGVLRLTVADALITSAVSMTVSGTVTGNVYIIAGGGGIYASSSLFQLNSDVMLSWTVGGGASAAADLFLARLAAASLVMGAAPAVDVDGVAQTLGARAGGTVSAGTTGRAGGSMTFTGGAGSAAKATSAANGGVGGNVYLYPGAGGAGDGAGVAGAPGGLVVGSGITDVVGTNPLCLMQRTWNSANTMTGLKVVITDTASGAGSFALQILGGAAGATALFSVTKAGFLNIGSGLETAGNIQSGTNLIAAAASFVYWNTRSVLASPLDGQINVTNNAQTIGVGLDFATDAVLKIRTRAQTGDAALTCAGITASGQVVVSLGAVGASSVAPTGNLDTGLYFPSNNILEWAVDGVGQIRFGSDGRLTSIADFALGASVSTSDTFLSRKAAATWHLGAADAASPVAQTLGAQGARSGTDTDTGGASFTMRSGIGTGTGAVSSLIFATPTVVASGTGAQSQVTRLSLSSAGLSFADGVCDIAFGTVTGTKIGTATTQKLAFYNSTPIVQGAAVGDASGGAVIDVEARAALNTLLARVRAYGLLAP